MAPACAGGWEALRGDPLPWLLAGHRPNLHWRVLVELVGRPRSSPAVRRARDGASAAEPVASLLAELHPDGTWATSAAPWARYRGQGWRLVAAVLWGADPEDPRLHAAAGLMLENGGGDGGFAPRSGAAPEPTLTARLLQAVTELGWWRHPRCQEAVAWLEEPGIPWGDGGGRAVTAVAALTALTTAGETRRPALRERALAELGAAVAGQVRPALRRLGHPNLGRTDLAELLAALALAGAPWSPALTPALSGLQRLQIDGGRWRRTAPVPASLPIPPGKRPRPGAPSRWVTLRASVGLMNYSVEAGLTRLFPRKPGP